MTIKAILFLLCLNLTCKWRFHQNMISHLTDLYVLTPNVLYDGAVMSWCLPGGVWGFSSGGWHQTVTTSPSEVDGQQLSPSHSVTHPDVRTPGETETPNCTIRKLKGTCNRCSTKKTLNNCKDMFYTNIVMFWEWICSFKLLKCCSRCCLWITSEKKLFCFWNCYLWLNYQLNAEQVQHWSSVCTHLV